MRLLVFLGMGCLFGCGTTTEIASLPAAPGPRVGSALSGVEERAFALVNGYRARRGRSALVFDEVLYSLAQRHSREMLARGALSHAGFASRASAARAALSVTSVSENVAYNAGYRDPAKEAFEGWVESRTHEANMRGDYRVSAVALATDGKRYFFTQLFAR
ncbi:MAG: CAP domain-containing protein [Verrucomicrobiota bacterium]